MGRHHRSGRLDRPGLVLTGRQLLALERRLRDERPGRAACVRERLKFEWLLGQCNANQ